MNVSSLNNNLQSQPVRQPSKTLISEKAKTIHAKLNENEQNFLDKDTVEKALQDISDSQAKAGLKKFSIEDDSSEEIKNQSGLESKPNDLANELAIRIQANNNQSGIQPKILSLGLDDAGILVNNTDSNKRKTVVNTFVQTEKTAEQQPGTESVVQRHISITA